jgi:hypothetical protein
MLCISENGFEFLKIYIRDLKAMALSMDYEPIKPFILEASVKCNADVQLCPVNTEVSVHSC